MATSNDDRYYLVAASDADLLRHQAPKKSGSRTIKQDEQRALPEKWQSRAWRYYESIGAVHFVGTWTGRQMQKVELVLQRRTDGEWETVEESDGSRAWDAFESFRASPSDLGQLQYRWALNRFLTGECYLCVTLWNGRVRWEIASTDEITVDAERDKVTRRPFGARVRDSQLRDYTDISDTDRLPENDSEIRLYRLWRPHPQWSARPDSPLLGVDSDCEEFLTLSAAVDSRAKSQVSNGGILAVPKSTHGSEDERKKAEEAFMEDLQQSLTAAITDPSSPSSVCPLVVHASNEVIEGMRYLTVTGGGDGEDRNSERDQALLRIARGIDAPPELVMGTGGMNHWSAWQVDEAKWREYLMPEAQALCTDLDEVMLHPLIPDDEIGQYRVWYDGSAVLVKPDRTQDALRMHSHGVISDQTLRRSGGFDEADAPVDGDVSSRVERPPGSGTPRSDGPPEQAAAEMQARAVVHRFREAAGTRVTTQARGKDRSEMRDVPREDVIAHFDIDVNRDLIPDTAMSFAASFGLDPERVEALLRFTLDTMDVPLRDVPWDAMPV